MYSLCTLFIDLYLYDACTFLYVCYTSIKSLKILICLNKLLFHEQTLFLLKHPKCSLSLIKVDLFILLWQWPHTTIPWRVSKGLREQVTICLHICVCKNISGWLPHRKFIPCLQHHKHMFFLCVQKVRKKETFKQSMPNTANISPKWQSSPACPIFNSQWHSHYFVGKARNLTLGSKTFRWHL